MAASIEDLISDTEDLLYDKNTIPPCPKIAIDIRKEIERGYDNADFGRIANLVEKDVAVAGKILELMNSPFYRRDRGEVRSIRGALNLMGLQCFYGVALAMLVQNSIPKGNLKKFEKFWSHSVATAGACGLLSGIKREFLDLRDQLYIIGLFHDFGVPFLMRLFPGYGELTDRALSWGDSVVDTEIERYKTSHCIVGYVIAKSWRLPSTVREVILGHHDVTFDAASAKEPVNRLKAILILAEIILRNYQNTQYIREGAQVHNQVPGKVNDEEPGRGNTDGPAEFMVPSEVLSVLGLDEDDIKGKREEIFAMLTENGYNN